MNLAKGSTIRLDLADIYQASSIGVARRLESIRLGYKESFGADQDSVEMNFYKNVIGAQAELAFALMTGLEWLPTINVGKDVPDVAPDWQVRWAAHLKNGLVVRDNDDTKFKYALMSGETPVFKFYGWIDGNKAKNKEWYRDVAGRKAPAFWVPINNLI